MGKASTILNSTEILCVREPAVGRLSAGLPVPRSSDRRKMERDAFASLFSKQRTPAFESKQGHLRGSPLASKSAAIAAGRRPTAPQGGSRFVECPVCGNSVHSSLAQSHVERCCISSGAVEGTGTQPKDTPQEQSTRQERPPASPCGTLQEVNKIICSCTSGEGSRDCAGLPSQSSVCTVGAVDPAKRLHGCAKSHDVVSASQIRHTITRYTNILVYLQ